MIHTYRNLLVWQKSVDLTVHIYSLTDSFPKTEQYGLVSQMRRASVSISSNIAEGRSRVSRKSFAQFLSISHGSACELETQIEISKRLCFGNADQLEIAGELLGEIKAMLGAMMKKLNPL